MFVLDDHERFVENVGHLAVVALANMIHILRTTCHDADRSVVDEEVHQVEEVTALLNKRSAGIAIKSVPVADLHQERESVLTDSHHLHLANSPGSNLGQLSSVPGHIAVGNTVTDSGTETLVELWNGSSWSVVDIPNASTFEYKLLSVSCVCVDVLMHRSGLFHHGCWESNTDAVLEWK